jgi:hypothetical protein
MSALGDMETPLRDLKTLAGVLISLGSADESIPVDQVMLLGQMVEGFHADLKDLWDILWEEWKKAQEATQ